MSQTIKCPHCDQAFPLDDLLTHKIEQEISQKYELLAKQKEQKVQEQVEKLNREAQQVQKARLELEETVSTQVAASLTLEKEKLTVKLRQEEEAKFGQEITKLKEHLQAKDIKLDELINEQVNLFKEKELLAGQKKEMELTLLKKEAEIRYELEQSLNESLAAKYQFQIAELNKKLDDARKTNEEMDRKLKQGSQQTQGEVLELEFEDILRREFADDDIRPVGKGVTGADIIQVVKNRTGVACGLIVWETKRTKNWVDGWITKLKEDQRREKADVAIIVTQAMPDNIKQFGIQEGVWVTGINTALGLAYAIRQNLLNLTIARQSNEDRSSKAQVVYSYLISNAFKQRIEIWIEYFKSRREEIDKERLYFSKKWEKEEKSIQKIIENTAGIYGDLQGMIGTAFPKIDTLELPE